MTQKEQTVLRCAHCNKPFDKESPLKRHGYYCRSRRPGHKATRARSCAVCVKRKVRCDNRRPECSYCIQKGIECFYTANVAKDGGNGKDEEKLDGKDGSPESLKGSFGGIAAQDADYFVDLSLTKPGLPDTRSAKLGGPTFDCNDLDITFNSFINESMADPPNYQLQPHQMSIPAAPARTIRSIIARPRPDIRSQRTIKLIMHALKSYLRMMQHDNTLPPFIHPGLESSSAGSGRMEPMANCMSLMHMLNSEIQGSRKLFWKNVRLECERLLVEYMEMSRLELLTGMQALSIYIFVRLDEGQTEDNNFEAMLLAVVTALAHRFNCSKFPNHQQPREQNQLESMWHEWVVKESVNRLCLIYRIIDMLAYFEPASMCDLPSDLLLAPLPSRKRLWESTNEFSWSLESSKDIFREPIFGLNANGDLVKWNGHELHSNIATPCAGLGGNKDPANWEEWCAGMDSLGGLVLLAASLVG